ncbi:MAG: pyruvate, phosphate dikinase [Myxococcota bacterium]
MSRYVYRFDEAPPTSEPKRLLGGKGAGLNAMTRIGVPVPPGFTITTEISTHFRAHASAFPDGLEDEVVDALRWVERRMGRTFGDHGEPLLVSVRSGAAVSMPGMMDTILNLGLNDHTVEGLADASGDRRFAFDAYRRLIQMYGDVVLGVEHASYEEAFAQLKDEHGDRTMPDSRVPAEALGELVEEYKQITEREGAAAFPQDVRAQLWGAVRAVFQSWDNPRARRYRRMQNIPDDIGTACNVQAMVFGNMGDDSGSGVAFTRNPSTGEKILYGEYLSNAQGEDVVAGIRTPLSLTAESAPPGREEESLERQAPEVFRQIRDHCANLERTFRDMQDIEFTVERGQPFILQTRDGKRTTHAAVRVAVDMVEEGLIERDEAVLRVDPEGLDQLLHPRLPTPDELAARGVHSIATGLPASPGAATGRIVFDADEAERCAADGREVVLVRRETSPEDIHGMKAAEGILTATGGMTSHAAVVARGLGKCCVAGAAALHVDYANKTLSVRVEREGQDVAVELAEGDVITLDGTHGRVYQGEVEAQPAASMPQFDVLMEWADAARRMRVRANADSPRGARSARGYGAEGIGLCRTEHMFFAEERLLAVRCLALAESQEVRRRWLAELEPMQRRDFVAIFRAMEGLPVTIRLLDWPLHEFLPREDRELGVVAEALGIPVDEARARARDLTETNPMLGRRGVRLGLLLPEIYRMQARAILEAALACTEEGLSIHPEIMIPVVSMASELAAMRAIVDEVARDTGAGADYELAYRVGTMVEVPRACLVADRLAEHAAFFSFGTNDLTQTVYGISRDDAGRFLPAYLEDPRGLLSRDPFAHLDPDGVGRLVEQACHAGRRTRPELGLGLCGEHGGDPSSIAVCERLGLDYVSCSPPRLPVARLAAAQAALRHRGQG